MALLYSVYDKVTKRFSLPVAQDNHNSARRWFKYVVSNSEMVAEDLQLWYVGTFSQDTAELSTPEVLELVADFEEVTENEKV